MGGEKNERMREGAHDNGTALSVVNEEKVRCDK
jgi:hypothetical protein